MYNRRVSKCHPRVEAYGAVDELNSALGMARASGGHPFIRENLLKIQTDMVILMGQLATLPDDLPRYIKDGYKMVTPDLTAKLDELVHTIESQKISFHGWVMPGDNPSSATLDNARAICRRAERQICALQEAGQLQSPEMMIYLNRLSDVLWLMARWREKQG